MSDVLRHTPYDGSSRPFSIGLRPLDLAEWIEPDAGLRAYLDEKEALFAAVPERVFRAEAGTEGAQREVFDLLAAHLPARFPQLYVADGDGLRVVPADRTVRLVQEDLCLMRAGPDGYRLVAAALAFPSSWSLAEKFARPMAEIHAGVPGYAGDMGRRIDRIFQSLRTDIPVFRLNWSLYPDADLHHPESKRLAPNRNEGVGEGGLSAFVRVERQTLRRLPESGDILFTIKVLVDPLDALLAHPDGPRLATSLRDQLLALDAGQLAYKGLALARDRVADRLAAIAATAG